MAAAKSKDDIVARMTIDKILGDSKQTAAIMGPPTGMGKANPQQEMELWNEVNPKVDVLNVMRQRMAFHLSEGLPPEDAYLEATLETAAVTFRARLAMVSHLPTLTEQAAELERLADKAEKIRLSKQPPDTEPPMASQPAPTPPSGPVNTDGAAAPISVGG